MSGFSADELAAIPDKDLVEAIVGVVAASSVGSTPTQVLEILEASPEGFGIVHCVWLLDAEIANGGFHQYFWNHGHVFVELTRRALTRLDANEHLAVFDEAMRLADVKPMRAGKKGTRAVLEAFSTSAKASPLNALDDRWYSLPAVDPLLVTFVRQNPLSVWEED